MTAVWLLLASHPIRSAHPDFAKAFWTLGSVFGIMGYALATYAIWWKR